MIDGIPLWCWVVAILLLIGVVRIVTTDRD